MAYSKSPITLLRIRDYLTGLERGETLRWSAPFPQNCDAAKWAYKIREGLYVATKHPLRFPGLARIASSVLVSVVSEGTVQASVIQSSSEVSVGDVLVVPAGLPAKQALSFPGPRTRRDVAAQVLSLGEHTQGPLVFPDATCVDSELQRLAQYVASKGWAILKPTGNGLTLVRESADLPSSVKVQP